MLELVSNYNHIHEIAEKTPQNTLEVTLCHFHLNQKQYYPIDEGFLWPMFVHSNN
jgi:hypothetical protein